MSSDKPGEAAAPRQITIEEAIRAAQQLQRACEYDHAEALYKAVLEAVPEEPNALHFLGVLRHQQGRNEEALALIARAAQYLPGESGPWVNLGNVLLESQRYHDAVDAYKQASILAPENILIYNNLGLLHSRRGHFELAEPCFRQALTLAPNAIYVLINYSDMLKRQGRFEEAVSYGLKSLTLDPNGPLARRVLVTSYMLTGDRASAIRVLRQWLELDPGHPEALHLLAGVGDSSTPARAPDAYILSGSPRLPCARVRGRRTRARHGAGHIGGRRARCGVRHRPVRGAPASHGDAAGRGGSVSGHAGKSEGTRQL
jgi:Flp pilus assembly protein TadD